MKTDPNILQQLNGDKADKILRSCVHCGFCNANCPTYGILSSELDSPRGRIYLIKEALEGKDVSKDSMTHLDRCLTCRSCESTCPSGVEYGHLLDIGREFLEKKFTRSLPQRAIRYTLRKSLNSPLLMKTATTALPFLKHSGKKKYTATSAPAEAGTVLMLSGCVQPSFAPNINHASKQVLQTLGYEVKETPQKQCCGAINHHLSAQEDALQQVKTNIDAWYEQLKQGVKAIISTASGCGVMVKDYADLLSNDPQYLSKAQAIVDKTKDISEFLQQQDLSVFKNKSGKRVAFHSPCTLQHGQRILGTVEKILSDAGYQLTSVEDPHLCCGSAGTYSILQKELSLQLRTNKLEKLQKDQPEIIATANIGCLLHMQKGTKTPVKHWIELLLE